MQHRSEMRRIAADRDVVVGAPRRFQTNPRLDQPKVQANEKTKEGIYCFAEGSTLFQSGQKAAAGYQILSGAVLLSRLTDRDTVQVLEAHGERAIIGISSDPTYDCSAIAMTRTIARRIGQVEVRQSLQMQMLITEQLARSLARVRERILLYGRKAAPRLVASVLLELPRCASHRLFGEDLKPARDVRVMMSPVELASCIGLTAKTVRSVLANLAADDVICISGRRLLVIHDPAALQRIASGEVFQAHPQCYYEEKKNGGERSKRGDQK